MTPFSSSSRAWREAKGPALACYFPLGDPRVPVETIDIYADHGVDVLEIGLASDNPSLDGPDVRDSMARVDRTQARWHLDALLDRLARHRHAPATLLMSYADDDHPGREDQTFWAGLDSALVVAGASLARRQQIEQTAKDSGLALSVFLPLPLQPEGVALARAADFYVMLQAAAGVTGARDSVDTGNAERIAALRAAGVTVPILPGFGISNGEQAQALRAQGADGVVVGSAVLKAALEGPATLATLLQQLRGGLDA